MYPPACLANYVSKLGGGATKLANKIRLQNYQDHILINFQPGFVAEPVLAKWGPGLYLWNVRASGARVMLNLKVQFGNQILCSLRETQGPLLPSGGFQDFRGTIDPEELFRRIFGDANFRQAAGGGWSSFTDFADSDFGFAAATEVRPVSSESCLMRVGVGHPLFTVRTDVGLSPKARDSLKLPEMIICCSRFVPDHDEADVPTGGARRQQGDARERDRHVPQVPRDEVRTRLQSCSLSEVQWDGHGEERSSVCVCVCVLVCVDG